ncbi:MAG: L-threonylcarbamoyladenylate synthase [Candidatus Woesearchaeota archaeon]
MQVFTKEEIERRKESLFKKIAQGAIFIYPTDTVYGIGCSALNDRAVLKVRKIKKRADKHFSVIVPSKQWIKDNCVIDSRVTDYLKKLPGPYTLIMNEKARKAVAKSVNFGKATLGIRIPKHWISTFVSELGIPIITPSANISGKEVMTSIDDLDSEIRAKVDFMLDEGVLKGNPSNIIDLTGKKPVVLR